MEHAQPKHWDSSFECVSSIVVAIAGLILLVLLPTALPLVFSVIVLALALAVALIPIALIAVIGYSLWRLFFSKA